MSGTEFSDDELAIARKTLVDMLDAMAVTAEVVARHAEPDETGAPTPGELLVTGDDLGFLLGPRGDTLAALQYLVRALLAKQFKRNVTLVIDIDGWRERRREQLRQLANRIATQVIARNRPMALEPMPPDERRVIHMALREHPAVRTESVGEGNRRKVQILPR
jgi:spoIIIJ-associated protein